MKKWCQKGASLAETLVTVLILSIAVAAAAGGAAVAYNVYKQVREKADAETLLSTSVLAVSGELYEAADVTVEGTSSSTETASQTETTGKVAYFYNGDLNYNEVIANSTNSSSEKGIYHQYLDVDTGNEVSNDPAVADKTQPLDLYAQLSSDGIEYLGNGRFRFTIQVFKGTDSSKPVDQQTVYVRSTLMK